MKATIVNLFYLSGAKINSLGLMPIYHLIMVDGKRIDKITGKYIDPTKWSVESGRMRGHSDEARTINSHLDYLAQRTVESEKNLFKKDIEITHSSLKNDILNRGDNKRNLIPIFQDHNDRIKELVGKEYAPRILERYETSLKHTKEFIEWKYGISDIEITKIDHAYIMDCEFYLRTVINCANNTAVKYIKNFSKIIKICIANDWITKNPFANYKSKVKQVERVYLNGKETQDIMRKDFKNERLSIVRDIFIICWKMRN